MVFYFVQRGETLYAIAKRYQTTVHAIVAANRLEDPNMICPGQALIIPRPGEVPSPPPGGIVHLVRPGETVFQLAIKFGSSPHEILRANQIAHPEFVLPGQQLVIPEPMETGDEWPMLGRTPGRTGASPITLQGRPVDGWTYTPRKSLNVRPSAPVIRYDRVYAGLGDGHFYSLDRHTGRVKWRLAADGVSDLNALGAYGLPTPAVFDGLTYLCAPDGAVTAVDAYSGRQIWQVKLGGPITSSPAVSEGVLYVGCWDQHLYALEAKTGSIAWKLAVSSSVALPVCLGDDHLFAVAECGSLYAIDAQTGKVCWQKTIPQASQPVFAEVVVLVGGTACDPKTGETLWQVEAHGTDPVAHQDQVIYPGARFDLFTGVRSMEFDLELFGVQANASESEEGVEGDSAVPMSEWPVRGQVAAGPLLIGFGHDERLHAWEVETGKARWSVALKAPGQHAPAVAHGQAAIALEDGSLQTYRFIATKSPE